MIDATARRDRLLLMVAVALVCALAWAWLLAGAGMDMNPLDMTAMAGMDGWLMQPAVWTPAYALLVFAMWWVMMLAMMLPGAAPTLLLFARVNRKNKTADAPRLSTALFAAGYLLVWGGFCALATALQWGLEWARALSPMLALTHRWVAAAILVGAGLWQWTPFKAMCLRHCQSPIGFLVTQWRPGPMGALRMGLSHGSFCVGCCWFLMGLLFLGGVMNLYWIVGITLYVLAEKRLVQGHWLARAVGLALVGWGVWMVLPAASA